MPEATPSAKSDVPPMVFDAAALLSDERMVNGPMVVWWNQDEEETPNRPHEWGDPPRVRLRDRLLGRRPFKVEIRLTPPPAEDLEEFGHRIAAKLGLPWKYGPPRPEDRAVWLPGEVLARTAPHALGSAGLALKQLDGVSVSAAQIRVEEWAE
jgi:hypothetical protein